LGIRSVDMSEGTPPNPMGRSPRRPNVSWDDPGVGVMDNWTPPQRIRHTDDGKDHHDEKRPGSTAKPT
jgi:hypothetical protein